jgi:hypothetical protein
LANWTNTTFAFVNNRLHGGIEFIHFNRFNRRLRVAENRFNSFTVPRFMKKYRHYSRQFLSTRKPVEKKNETSLKMFAIVQVI